MANLIGTDANQVPVNGMLGELAYMNKAETLDRKQDTLVSGTNIKTINGTSVLGSGDIAVQAVIVNGTYTPTLVASSNVPAITFNACRYFRIGDIVHVQGSVSFTENTGDSYFKITIPIASDFTANGDLSGSMTAKVGLNNRTFAAVYADTTDNAVTFDFNGNGGSDASHNFIFTYVVK